MEEFGIVEMAAVVIALAAGLMGAQVFGGVIDNFSIKILLSIGGVLKPPRIFCMSTSYPPTGSS